MDAKPARIGRIVVLLTVTSGLLDLVISETGLKKHKTTLSRDRSIVAPGTYRLTSVTRGSVEQLCGEGSQK